MVYFTLPNFYKNFHINNFFVRVNELHPEWFKHPVAFVAASGNFPYNYWNGGFNNCDGDGCVYGNVYDCNKDMPIPLRLNCANIFLNEHDFEDSVANTILDICHDSSNLIEVSNLDFYIFLKEKYKKYRFIFSKEADLIFPFNANIINELNEKKYFSIISLPKRFSKDFETLKEIQKPGNIELMVNSNCKLSCPNFNKCHESQHINQYNYSYYNPFLVCESKYAKTSEILISFDEIYNQYVPLGFRRFSFDEIFSSDRHNLFVFLTEYFIKEECKGQLYSFAMDEGVIRL